ncbi:MAG: type II toxin-antitoxin system VapC family toxin [Candidatus Hodarchaeales archaeon]
MFVDSVVWIALASKKDQWHKKAVKLKERIIKAEKIYITDLTINETYNFLLRKVSYSAAFDTLEMFLESPKITILFNNFLSLSNTKKILAKYRRLSLTDANIVWFSENFNIKEVLSFDAGFDVVKTITRVY